MDIKKLTFTHGGTEYTWSGGFGVQIESFEDGPIEGDVRVIDREMFFVYQLEERAWRPNRVGWCIFTGRDSINIDRLHALKRQFFGS